MITAEEARKIAYEELEKNNKLNDYLSQIEYKIKLASKNGSFYTFYKWNYTPADGFIVSICELLEDRGFTVSHSTTENGLSIWWQR